MNKLCRTYLLLTVLLNLAGCAQESELVPEPVPASKYPICWSVDLAQGQETRALVDNTLLKASCTAVADGTNESIGIWGQYTLELNGQERTNQEFNGESLTYGVQDEVEAWSYTGGARYWRLGAVYDFRACYPQRLMAELMTESDVSKFQGGPINTMELQEDILVAALQVNTETADLTQAVPLNMQHVFAAIQFKIKAATGFTPPSGEGVTSCWLQNQSKETNLFSPSGHLLHTGNENPEIIWYPSESSDAPMYVWKHEGLNFNTTSALYASNGGRDGEIYTRNDGWLLVVPQQVKAETLCFCYTLKITGDKVFTVKIPAITYEHGKRYNYLLEISGSNTELSLEIAPWNKLDSNHEITV